MLGAVLLHKLSTLHGRIVLGMGTRQWQVRKSWKNCSRWNAYWIWPSLARKRKLFKVPRKSFLFPTFRFTHCNHFCILRLKCKTRPCQCTLQNLACEERPRCYWCSKHWQKVHNNSLSMVCAVQLTCALCFDMLHAKSSEQ